MGDFERYVNLMLTFKIELTQLEDPVGQLSECVEEIYNVVCEPHTAEQNFQRNQVMFGAPEQSESRFNKLSSFAGHVYTMTQTLFEDSRCTEDDFMKLQDKLNSVLDFINSGHEAYVHSHRQMHCRDIRACSLVGQSASDNIRSALGEVKFKPHQLLMREYLKKAHHLGLRRYKEELFIPLTLESGHFTYFYKHYSGITEFIYNQCYPYIQNIGLFQMLTESRQNIPMLEKWLANCVDTYLLELNPDRTVFAFRNGVYMARDCKFYMFDPPEGYPHKAADLDANQVVACNFIDCLFSVAEHDDPYDIPTPNFQSILSYQQIPEAACRWCYALIGRLFFDVGEMDNWQVHLMFKGTAGTGKSTLLHLAAMLYRDIDVGNIMSDGRKDFGIEHLHGKFLNMCLDLNKKMTSIPQATWNQMVSGEQVTVDRKNRTALSESWKAQMAFAGNDYPPWQDQSGNVVRRLVLFLFTQFVRNVDPNLEARCKQNLGSFLRKCVELYHRKVRQFGENGIWDQGVLPEYLWNCRREMQAQTNGLQSFLLTEQCVIEDGATVSFTAFSQVYRKHCENYKMAYQALTRDFYTSVFTPMGIEVRQAPADADDLDGYDGFQKRKYLRGVALAQ
jgi:hypothetical protein